MATLRGRLETLLRYGALGLDKLAMRGLGAVARHARKIEISIDGTAAFTTAPLTEIPVPSIDVAAHDDPLPLILASPVFRETIDYFSRNAAPSRSLLSVDAQALLHVLARNLRPDHVIEIGVFKGATTEAIARALHANGQGVVHAVDPFRSEYIEAVFAQWPAALARRVSFHPRNSVQFFDEMRRGDIRPSLALIDGNHDYPFAAFDIESAARILRGGGFIFVDNVTQPGPFFAARDFLARNPGWIECGGSTANYDRRKTYDKDRTRIRNTDLIALRAPRHRTIADRPWSPGQRRVSHGEVRGVRIPLAASSGRGTLYVQIVLRGFGAQPAEVADGASVALDDARGVVDVSLATPLSLTGKFALFSVEPCLIWEGEAPLRLAGESEVF